MKLLCIRSVALRCGLSAAIVSLTLAAHPLSAQESKDAQKPKEAQQSKEAQESKDEQAAPPISEMYDEDFAKHVDLRMLGVAWQTLDAKLMTDVALQLREAERVLGRKHPKITSDQILKLAGKAAADSDDKATLERLARVAQASGNSAEVNEMKQMKSLAAASRALKGDLINIPMFSANDVNNGAIAAFANTILQIRAAKVAADKDTLKDLAEGTDLLSSLSDDHRSRLKGLIDDAMESVGEADDSMSAINKLTGPSRFFGDIVDFAVPSQFRAMWDAAPSPGQIGRGFQDIGRGVMNAPGDIGRGVMNAPGAIGRGVMNAPGAIERGAGAIYDGGRDFGRDGYNTGRIFGGYIIGDDRMRYDGMRALAGLSRSLASPSGESETSNVAGGMKYVMSPLGAVVQSPGRIGSLVFAPGDVILSVADLPLGPGTTLDKAIDYGYVSGTRSVTVRDVSSGQVTTLMF